MPASRTDGTWWCVVPVKPLAAAKSRLLLPPAARMALVVAMAADTVATALHTPAVAGVVVVTDDRVTSTALARLGAHIVPEPPGGGLNSALAAGARAAVMAAGPSSVAALLPDLPALTPTALDDALVQAAGRRRAYVADASGVGTTMLTAAPGTALDPMFGAGSSARHAGSGAFRLTGVDPRLQSDVDTLDELAAAARLGLGPRSTAALRGAELDHPARRSSRTDQECGGARVDRVHATVADWSPTDGSTVVVTDAGARLDCPATVFAASGLRRLRSGQRVRLALDRGGAVIALTLVTLPLPVDVVPDVPADPGAAQ